MARYGIVSDIHGNLSALRATVRFLVEEASVGQIVCLGDIVGYNAEPDACVEELGALGIESVIGNHDLIATGGLGLERCAVRPAFALRRTREVLGAASRSALLGLPSHLVLEGEAALFHGGFRDVCEYVTSPSRALANAALARAEVPGVQLCFFGHTHEQRVFLIERGCAWEEPARAEVDVSKAGRVVMINPGSVDGARNEGARRARAAVFDSDRRVVSFHAIPYDHAAEERRAVEGGYRMGPIEERIRAALRTFARRKGGVLRRLDRWRCAAGWARGGRSV